MTDQSTRLAVTPVGRIVAQSVLHPRSANQFITYAAQRASELVSSRDDPDQERLLHFALLHAAFTSHEYMVTGSGRFLPYQLNPLVANPLADEAEHLLIEQPWNRYPKAANAALAAIRWTEGTPRNQLAPEFDTIGSGVLQNMVREAGDILFSWADCLMAATGSQILDEERPAVLRGQADLLRTLRNLAAAIRVGARALSVGVPPDVGWMAILSDEETGQRLLSRDQIIALLTAELMDPTEILRHENRKAVVGALKSIGTSQLDTLLEKLKAAVLAHRNDRRDYLWKIAIEGSPDTLSHIVEATKEARGNAFEKQVEHLFDAVGITYERLDDGQTAGAPDYLVGPNHKIQILLELKSSEGKGGVGLNDATDVVKAAAIVGMDHLPKVTLSNPGFDPNVAGQARNVKDLALVEACQFARALSLIANGEVDKDRFLDWLAQPGTLSVTGLRVAQGRDDD